MKLLEDKIISNGVIAPGDVLKVGSFLNQQMDIPLMVEMGKEFYRLFGDCGVTKILTVEASGIGIACITAQFFNSPVVFAKKSKTSNIAGDTYTAKAFSFTHGNTNDLVVPKAYLSSTDRVLLIDDFLANGQALEALLSIVAQAGATAVGCGVAVEKAYQGGGDAIRQKGIRVESLAKIASMSVEDGITFC